MYVLNQNILAAKTFMKCVIAAKFFSSVYVLCIVEHDYMKL